MSLLETILPSPKTLKPKLNFFVLFFLRQNSSAPKKKIPAEVSFPKNEAKKARYNRKQESTDDRKFEGCSEKIKELNEVKMSDRKG